MPVLAAVVAPKVAGALGVPVPAVVAGAVLAGGAVLVWRRRARRARSG